MYATQELKEGDVSCITATLTGHCWLGRLDCWYEVGRAPRPDPADAEGDLQLDDKVAHGAGRRPALPAVHVGYNVRHMSPHVQDAGSNRRA